MRDFRQQKKAQLPQGAVPAPEEPARRAQSRLRGGRTTIYHMLKDGTAYCDLGAAHFDKHSAQVKVNRLVAQLAKLGYEASLQLAQAA